MKILRIPLVIVLVVAGRTFHANALMEANLCTFGSSDTDGTTPYARLAQGNDGNFYGTTYNGGFYGGGTVFQTSPSGTYTNLYSFGSSDTDGANPEAGLVQGSDGNFYGTTDSDNTYDYGTVFRISPSGTYTSLYLFGSNSPNDGFNPSGGLVQDSDGNFYGTTFGGGTNDGGTMYRISASGSYTSLYTFGNSPTDGANPYAGLAQGSDGNFYGTTYYGGTSGNCYLGCGTVFRISPSGSYTNLHSFVGPPHDGAVPLAKLVQGSDGNFYGTTSSGGANNTGTIFRISASGSYTSLYTFGNSPTDGANPYAGLAQGSDGNFYGATSGGGTSTNCPGGCGSVFRISPKGSYTNLYSFDGSPNDGAAPHAGLVQGSDGNFYGTTAQGGTNDSGTVFILIIPLNLPPYPINQITGLQFFSVFDSTDVAVLVPSVAGETYQLQYSDSLSPTNWLNTGVTITRLFR